MTVKIIAALSTGALTIGAAAALVLTNGDPTPAAPTPIVKVSDCQHRGVGHREKHGGLEDDRYHRFHGEPVTCQDKGNTVDFYDGKDADDHGKLGEPNRRHGQSEDDESKDSPLHRRDTSVKPNLFDLIS